MLTLNDANLCGATTEKRVNTVSRVQPQSATIQDLKEDMTANRTFAKREVSHYSLLV